MSGDFTLDAGSIKIPSGKRIYCIGDIHGRDDLLRTLLNTIAKDAASYSGQKTLIFLGDYIDRGMHSKEVIETLTNAALLPEFEKIFLCGNHEQTLMSFLHEDSAGLKDWWHHGAQTTFYSYGIAIAGIPVKSKYVSLQQQLLEAIPDAHLNFYQSLKHYWIEGDYYFVHAGIKPTVPLQDQHEKDLCWIREEFLASHKIYEKMIVHGHSVVTEPEFWVNRISIDTGAYTSGKLTCLVLENETRRILDNHTQLEIQRPPLYLVKNASNKLPRPPNRANHFQHVLEMFKKTSADLVATAFISGKGLILASVLPDEMNENNIARLREKFLSFSMRFFALLEKGELEHIIIRCERGYIVIIRAGMGNLLLAVTNENTNLGLLLFDMQGTSNALTKFQAYGEGSLSAAAITQQRLAPA